MKKIVFTTEVPEVVLPAAVFFSRQIQSFFLLPDPWHPGQCPRTFAQSAPAVCPSGSPKSKNRRPPANAGFCPLPPRPTGKMALGRRAVLPLFRRGFFAVGRPVLGPGVPWVVFCRRAPLPLWLGFCGGWAAWVPRCGLGWRLCPVCRPVLGLSSRGPECWAPLAVGPARPPVLFPLETDPAENRYPTQFSGPPFT